MQHLLDDLNEDQKRAVTHGDGALLVIAGAGSGKTRVITRRIAWLLAHGVPERSILGVTFTNKAATEMAGRVHDLIPESHIRLSTFHSACAAFLRRSGPLLGFGHDFSIYDTEDRDLLIKALMKEHGLPVKEVRPSLLGAMISKLKNQGVGPGDFDPQPWIPWQRLLGQIYRPYQDALATNNAMDFDDLLLHFLKVLDEFEEERGRYARRFRHVLVDEFQDTNPIQYRIVRRLTEVHGNLCVVGDPDQSIYSFRGAEIDNILSFPNDHPGTTVVKLETNYRSTATILDFAQRVIDHNERRYEKVLRPHLGDGEPVRYLPCDTGRAEAREVAYRVRDLVDGGIDAAEIAVFYRARFLSRGLEESFRMVGVPYEIVGDVGFFGRKEIKDLCAFLQIFVNPRDTVALRRIINVPTRGIGKVSQDRILGEAGRRDVGGAELITSGDDIPGVSGRAARGVRELAGLLVEAQLLAGDSVEQTLRFLLERTDYVEFMCRTGSHLDVEREEHIQELLRNARDFDRELAERAEQAERREHAVASYLQQVSLLTDAYAAADGPAVQLMTVHSAKGLEFDHVFVIGLEDGVFPHSQSLDSADGLEEERRLFYVATTRARRTLTVLRADMRESFDNRPRDGKPSRFLFEAELEQRRRSYGESTYDESGDRVYHYGAPEEAEPDPAYDGAFAEGDRVRHATFGDGTILRCSGSGRSAKVEVLFPSGVRILLLEYANLERTEEGGESLG